MRLLSVEGHVFRPISIRKQAQEYGVDIAYGIQIKDKTDEYIHIAESALEGMSEAAVPGAFLRLVDQIPWCISICFWSLVNVSNTLLIHSKICSLLVPWRRLPEKGCGMENFGGIDGYQTFPGCQSSSCKCSFA
jgi:hypothetical protein